MKVKGTKKLKKKRKEKEKEKEKNGNGKMTVLSCHISFGVLVHQDCSSRHLSVGNLGAQGQLSKLRIKCGAPHLWEPMQTEDAPRVGRDT